MRCRKLVSYIILIALLITSFSFPTAIAEANNQYNQLSNYITNISNATTVAECLAQLNIGTGNVQILKSNGTALNSDAFVGTGNEIRVSYSDGSTESATVIVAGDIDEDGLTSASDYVQVRRSILGLNTLNTNQKYAADTNNDGSIDGTDYVVYRRYILGLSAIWSVVIDDNNNDDADIPDGFEFLDGVINLPESADWNVSGGQAIVPSGEDIPEVGQIITFGMEYAIKVESITQVDGQTVITYSTPELYEFLESIDIEGTAALDLSQFTPAAGVRVRSSNNFGLDIEINSEGLSATGEIPLEEPFKLNVGLEFANPQLDYTEPVVEYNFGMFFGQSNGQPLINVREAMIAIENINLQTHVGIGAEGETADGDRVGPFYERDDFVEFTIPIGKLPIVGIPGLGAEVEIDLNFRANGECYIDFGFSGVLGAKIVNNDFQNISSLQPNMSVGLAGAVEVYGEVELDAELFGVKLFSVEGEMGVHAGGSVDIRNTGMVCMDATVYPFAKLKAFEGTVIEDWLDMNLEISLIHEGNAPVKFVDIHFEDLERVPECTFKKGTIEGTVANADNRTQYISGARIEVEENIQDPDEDENVIFYSDANGRYTAKVDAGICRVRISADGYIPYESVETVPVDEIVYLQTYLMVEDEGGEGTIGGTVTNAVTGTSVSGVQMTARKGWNATTGEVVATAQTDSSGDYTFTLPLGNYTIYMERDGYISSHINVAVTKNGNYNCHATLNPDGESEIELGDLRVVLTWGATPRDLDSHLWGPTTDGSDMYHIYYSDMSYYEDGSRVAYLDVDDTTSYGPETTTVYDMMPVGVYNFYVHDYTNRSSSGSTAMANSGANVKVYMGEELIGQYNVPTSGSGTVWHVFSFDAENGTIRGVNTWSNVSTPSSVGSPYSIYALDSVDPLKDYELEPTDAPTDEPTDVPTDEPTDAPTDEPTDAPTDEPTDEPTDAPTDEPTDEPTDAPTDEPTDAPTDEPIDESNDKPVDEVTTEPASESTDEPTAEPTAEPVSNTDEASDESTEN